MSRRKPFVAGALRELCLIAYRYVAADARRLCGADGTVLCLKDVPDDIAIAIQEVEFCNDGRLRHVVLVDKVKAAKLLMRMTEAADGLFLDDLEQGHGRYQH